MKKNILAFLICFVTYGLLAENEQLSIVQYLEIVKKYHPVYIQTTLSVKRSEADILSSRGAFDPIFTHYFSKKTFDGKTYYQYNSPELIIPTWFGTEFTVGTENYEGSKVDPTKTFGSSSFIGVSIPLAKDLLIDKRRAALNQAKQMNKMSLQEQKAILNNLMYEASNAYWEWSKAHQIAENAQKTLEISQNRYQLIKKSFELGERPSIDTLEAYTQIQSYQNYLNNSILNVQKSSIALSSYLWNEQQQNVILAIDIKPDTAIDKQQVWKDFDLNLESILEKAETFHPELKSYDFKLNALQIEKQLKFQNLLPKINLDYQQLSPGNQFSNIFAENSFSNNYIAGLKIELPIPLRFGRGEYEKAKIKFQDEQINQRLKRNSIQIKVKQYHTEFENLKEQVKVQVALVENYKQLTRAEEIRIQNGEGSLFMINSREQKTLESIEKMIETRTKLFKSVYATQWAAGLLVQD